MTTHITSSYPNKIGGLTLMKTLTLDGVKGFHQREGYSLGNKCRINRIHGANITFWSAKD
jgi:hypothetical protein